MDSLAMTKTQKAFKKALAKLPENITGAYTEMLESRINSQNDDNRDLAFRIFGWITFAKRTLTWLELQHALAVDLDSDVTDFEFDNLYDENFLGSVCGGFIIIGDINQSECLINSEVKFARK